MTCVLAGLLVGAALGMSGSILRGMLRNSLADSFVGDYRLILFYGTSDGAWVLVSADLLVGWEPLNFWWVPSRPC